jgi:hypothetical protein
MSTISSGSRVTVKISSLDAQSSVLRVPLIVRSNSRFRISAVFESETALLMQLSVIDVRAMGALVSPLAVNQLDIPQQFDLRGHDENVSLRSSLPLDVTRPLRVFRGPRVSLGGTLNSPNNALQITLLIRLKTQEAGAGLVYLTFAGTPINSL